MNLWRALWPTQLKWYLALLLTLVVLTRIATPEVAFQASLRDRVPEMERRLELLEKRLVALPPERIERLIELLEAEAVAREQGR